MSKQRDSDDELDNKVIAIVYISGPMTGLPDYNYPMFHGVAEALRRRNFAVINPAEFFGGKADRTRNEYMRESILRLLEADAMVLLPGWEKSAGARLEVAICQELNIPINLVKTSEETPQTLF